MIGHIVQQNVSVMKTRIIVLSTLLFAWNLKAQQTFRIIPENSKMNIEGTSTVHDWEMDAEKFSCVVDLETDGPSMRVSNVVLTVTATGLVSGYSLMNDKTYAALKADRYPEIRFSLESSDNLSVSNGAFSGRATGMLYLAGVSKRIDVHFTGRFTGNGQLTISGSKKIDMTGYGIDPPTAMLGTLKTGKDVTVSFSLNFKQQGAVSLNY